LQSLQQTKLIVTSKLSYIYSGSQKSLTRWLTNQYSFYILFFSRPEYSWTSAIYSGFAPGFVNNKKGCTRISAASDKAYQLLAHGRWFSPASSTSKTGLHDTAEILLKVALNTIHQIKSNQIKSYMCHVYVINLMYYLFMENILC